MKQSVKEVRVYRFHSQVALHLATAADTQYLSPKLAIKLANQLTKYARDCKRVPFVDSELGTFEYQEKD